MIRTSSVYISHRNCRSHLYKSAKVHLERRFVAIQHLGSVHPFQKQRRNRPTRKILYSSERLKLLRKPIRCCLLSIVVALLQWDHTGSISVAHTKLIQDLTESGHRTPTILMLNQHDTDSESESMALRHARLSPLPWWFTVGRYTVGDSRMLLLA